MSMSMSNHNLAEEPAQLVAKLTAQASESGIAAEGNWLVDQDDEDRKKFYVYRLVREFHV